jgi:hypothetical protein
VGGREEDTEPHLHFHHRREVGGSAALDASELLDDRHPTSPQSSILNTSITTPFGAHTTIAMPLPRPVAVSRVANSISSQPQRALVTSSQRSFVRGFSNTKQRKAADHAHEDHYDPPSGWLFGVKPGEKPEKEGWETVWVWGFFGSLGLGVVAYAFKPDTS